MKNFLCALAMLALWSPLSAAERDDIKDAHARLAPSVAAYCQAIIGIPIIGAIAVIMFKSRTMTQVLQAWQPV
jgi:hypothetical protein